MFFCKYQILKVVDVAILYRHALKNIFQDLSKLYFDGLIFIRYVVSSCPSIFIDSHQLFQSALIGYAWCF